MFCSMLACGQNGEIGLNGELPWEGQYPEDREFYEGQTELALRIGTRGAIAHFSPNRPCCLVSANVQKPKDCIWCMIGKNSRSNKFLLFYRRAGYVAKKIIVGGVKWYHATASFVDRIYLTRIAKSFDSDQVTYPSFWPTEKNFFSPYEKH